MNTTDKIMAMAEAYADASFTQGLEQRTEDPAPEQRRQALRAEIEALVLDAERYRFIRDAGRSECISYEIRTYAMETLDGYVDAAIEDEAAMQEKQS